MNNQPSKYNVSELLLAYRGGYLVHKRGITLLYEMVEGYAPGGSARKGERHGV